VKKKLGITSKSAAKELKATKTQKVITVYLAYSTSPVPLDDILSLTKLPPIQALNIIEVLKKHHLAIEKKETGRGVYHKGDIDFQKYIKDNIPEREIDEIINTVIEFITGFKTNGEKKILSLAALYRRSGMSAEGVIWVKKAADMFNRSGDKEKAVEYYDAIINHFFKELRTSPPAPFIGELLDAVYQRVSMGLFYIMPFNRQIAILEKAHELAKHYGNSIILAKIKIHLGFVALQSGKTKRANNFIDSFWNLYETLPEKEELKKAFFFASMSTVMMGKFDDATNYYKQVVGTLEKFGESEEDLSAYLLLAFCQLSCGRISRGMGMIDIVREKARFLGFEKVFSYAEIMAANAMISLRKFKDAESYIKRLREIPLNEHIKIVSDNLIFINAYICCLKEEYEEAFSLIKKGFTQRKSPGMDTYDIGPFMPWIFDCLYILETKGFPDKATSLESALMQSLKRNNIFIKGVALRYRALFNMRKEHPRESILADLKLSEKLLSQAGAEIELARTRVATSNFHMARGETETAMSYMENASSFLHGMDPALFPQDLLEYMPHERKFDLIIERIASINQAFSEVKNKSDMLGLVMSAAMDSTSAMQCYFFSWDGVTLDLMASRNFDPASKDQSILKSFQEIIIHAIRKENEIILPMEDMTDRRTFHALGIYSFVGIPVKSNSLCNGYFAVGNHFGGGPFSGNMVGIVKMFASQIAVGLSYFGAYEELRGIKERFKDETIFHRREMGLELPIEKILGQSEAIQKVIQRIYQVAPTDSTVLIQGETGVGKELVAKALHNLSGRKDGPFIPVNLATFPKDLVASELFGHEKGAFSGAAEKKKGRLELADGGTIFLDEIGDLPTDIQVKLLRVLQEGTFERLGSSIPIRSDFRVITATNKNLRYEVEKGNLRHDLYYRLNVFPIHVPALRERKNDIPLLAQHFFSLFNKKFGKYINRIPAGELKKLMSYHWPGNVRELQHFIEKAVILSNGHEISFSGLELEHADSTHDDHLAVTILADIEREHIKKILGKTTWKISGPGGAASFLGLLPTTLRYRMKKLGIHKPMVSK
jgi:transcriptional regulator with GAF, ATPase, and Fis domain